MKVRSRSQLWPSVLSALLVAVTVSCSDAPLAPTTPSGPPATLTDLTGNWGGYVAVGVGETGMCFGFRWNAAQDGSAVSGQSAIRALGRGESFDAPLLGTMTAMPSGDGFAVSIVAPERRYESALCSMRGSGTMKAGLSMTSGTVTLEFTPGCNGNVYASRPSNTFQGTMNLSKGADASICP